MDSSKVKRINAERIETLEPETRALAERHIAACAEDGIELLVVQAFRNAQEQALLYARGRTALGRIVTNARPGWSWHNHGRAYDVAVLTGGEPDWNAREKYMRAGRIGEGLGLVWGGSFRGVRDDLGHFEHHPGLRLADFAVNALHDTTGRV